jgi:hypothetical protein
MFHRNDHISLFMPLLDIAVRLDDMLQRINPVYGRFERQHPVFGQAFVLGMASKIDGEGGGENLVTSLESCPLRVLLSHVLLPGLHCLSE